MQLSQNKSIRHGLAFAAVLAGLGCSALPVSAQTYAQITGPATITDGATWNLTWNTVGAPPASLVQNGVRAQGTVSLNGKPFVTALGNTVGYTAKSSAISVKFGSTTSLVMQMVLVANGAVISPIYNVNVMPGQQAPPPPPPTQGGNPAYASAACKYVLGVDCTVNGNPYASVGTYLVAQANGSLFPTQAAMQAYLMNYVGTNPGVKSAVIQQAAAGQAVCTAAATALGNAFSANAANTQSGLWNSYTQLAPIISGVLKGQCAAPPPPPPVTYLTPAQLNPAYVAVWGALWTFEPVAMMTNCPASTGASSCVRSALASYVAAKGAATLNPLIQPVFTQVMGFAPNSTQLSTLAGVFGRNWSGADDLATYLNGTKASWLNPVPAPTPLPSLAIPNSAGVNGPFVIAATWDQQPNISLCLDTGSWTSGAALVAHGCTGGNSQLFSFDSSNRIVMSANPQGALCITAGANQGDAATLTNCGAGLNQQWYVSVIPGLASKGTDNANQAAVLAARNQTINSGAPLLYSGGQIQNIGNNFCLDIKGAATNVNVGNPVISFGCQPISGNTARPWNQVWGVGHYMNNGSVYIFSRRNVPPLVGHVGWAVQLADGSWEAGAWDGLSVPIVNKGYFNGAYRVRFATEAQMRQYFGTGIDPQGRPATPHIQVYNEYMKYNIGTPVNSAAVFSLESESWDWGYGVTGNNCADVTYKILKAYGWSNLPSLSDMQVLAPNDWFDKLLGSNKPYLLP